MSRTGVAPCASAISWVLPLHRPDTDKGSAKESPGEAVPATVLVGVGSLVLLFGLKRFAPRLPAALIVTGLAILVVSVLNLPDRGVAVIGEIPAGIPGIAWPGLGLEA